jgi:hypothetical protein
VRINESGQPEDVLKATEPHLLVNLPLPTEPTVPACGVVPFGRRVLVPSGHRRTRSSELVDERTEDRRNPVVGRPEGRSCSDRTCVHGYGLLVGPSRSCATPVAERHAGLGSLLLWVSMISRTSSAMCPVGIDIRATQARADKAGVTNLTAILEDAHQPHVADNASFDFVFLCVAPET